MEYIEKEVGKVFLPKFSDKQLRLKDKITLGFILGESDYDVICDDVIDFFKLTEKLDQITSDIDKYIKTKYLKDYSQDKLLKYLNNRMEC